MNRFYTLILLVAGLMLNACGQQQSAQKSLEGLNWDQITEQARGSTVNWMMWQGSPYVNNYINNYVVPQVKERFNITLEISGGQGNQIVSTLLTEQEAGQQRSEIDIAWINGETFYQLRQIDALYGPFTERLPNMDFVDVDNPIIAYDFQQPVAGYEAPWSLTQWVMIYDAARVATPPRSMDELAAYVKQNPGTFTFPTQFVGMTFLKNLLIEMAGPETLAGDFDEDVYEKYSSRLWDYLNRLKPYFWKEGSTFPENPAVLNQLFSSGEVNFSMGFGATIDNLVTDGTYPETARAYALDAGTIKNTNYVGVARRSANKAGALVVINFLLSPEAQYQKMMPDGMASETVLNILKLPQKWQNKFEAIPQSSYAPSRATLKEKAVQELGSEYMIRLAEDFRTEVIQQ